MNQPVWNFRYFVRQLIPPFVVSLKRSLQPIPHVSKRVFDQTLEFSTDWFSRNEDN